MTEYDDHDYCFTCDKHEATCWCFHFTTADANDEDTREWLCWTPDACAQGPSQDPSIAVSAGGTRTGR